MELPLELEEWLDDLPLSRNLAKNFVRVFSDGVLVAEIVARQFPKLVQLHNYSEQNTLDGKRANWALLNKKVLSKLRCPLSAEQIDTLCQWSSSETLIEFLSILKLKMAAYEPIYLAQQASVTAKAQEEKDALRIKKHELKRVAAAENESVLTKESTQQPPPADVKPNSAIRSSAAGGRSKPANTPKRRHPDGNSHHSNAAAAPPLVELPSAESIDEMYMKLTDSLVADLTQLTSRLDALDAQSAEFDAQVRRHRQQNLEEMRKTAARVARLQLEQQEIEHCGATGAMVAIDNAFGDDIDSLSGQAWATLGPEDIDNFAVQQLVEEIDKMEAKAEEPNAEADSMYSSDSDDSLTPPPPPPRPPRPPHSTQQATFAPADVDQRETEYEHDDVDADEGDDERAQAAKPEQPEAQPETAQASADWLQCWDAASQKNYFANSQTGATQWEIPTAGIIKCRDASTQRVYFVDAATQQTAWRMDELSSVRSNRQSASCS